MKTVISMMFTLMMIFSASVSYAQCTEGTKLDANGDCVPEGTHQSGSSGVRG